MTQKIREAVSEEASSHFKRNAARVTAVYAFVSHRKGRFDAALILPEHIFAINVATNIARYDPHISAIKVSKGILPK